MTTRHEPHVYVSREITDKEYEALGWLSMRYGTYEIPYQCVEEFKDGCHRIEMSEPDAWHWKDDMAQEDAPFPCLGGELLDELVSLEMRIV